MPKELTGAEIREMFDRMNAPGSGTRELADWHARDGQGPVPESVKRMLTTVRSIPAGTRTKMRKTVSKDDS